ncbi:MAG TPA: glycerol-3-phosphate 1-O-acyltransferase PlsY [Candidatus Binataceae bacterium]|nr:glycerol-3-phosphate 1-O-acyltransferase PlsY [Candidatus Binataceae bacterium]
MTGPIFLTLAVPTLLAYLIGGLPFGYWFVRLSLGRDIRTMGSGNIGATNVHRTAGKRAGIIVLLLDIFKGLLAVWAADVSTHHNAVAIALAAAAVILGHCYPALLKFRGGKGVACFVGAFGYIAPLALLVVIAAFVIVVAMSKYISLGSLMGAFLFPFIYWWLIDPPLSLLTSAFFSAALIIYRHRGNIYRLRSGTEHAFSPKGKTA